MILRIEIIWILIGMILGSCTSEKPTKAERDPYLVKKLQEAVRVINSEQRNYGYGYIEIVNENERSEVVVFQNVLDIQDIRVEFMSTKEVELDNEVLNSLLYKLKKKVKQPAKLQKYVVDNLQLANNSYENDKLLLRLTGLLMIQEALRMNVEMIAF